KAFASIPSSIGLTGTTWSTGTIAACGSYAPTAMAVSSGPLSMTMRPVCDARNGCCHSAVVIKRGNEKPLRLLLSDSIRRRQNRLDISRSALRALNLGMVVVLVEALLDGEPLTARVAPKLVECHDLAP